MASRVTVRTAEKKPRGSHLFSSLKGDFRDRWLVRLGLPVEGWRSKLKHEVKKRPFSEPKELESLIIRLIDALPSRLRNIDLSLAETFGWLCLQAWQSGSHFPAFAENYAELVWRSLEAGKEESHAILISKLLGAENDRSGFQPLVLKDSEFIRESEKWIHAGEFDRFLKNPAKFSEYEQELHSSKVFRADWRLLCRAFPKHTKTGAIIHRTLQVERNWVRDGGAAFDTEDARFQAVFDLLCWKYCLWGVARSRPLLLKPSVVFGPWGTQIFVPSYLSFDPRRDLNNALIAKLHRARGVQRQGEAFVESRQRRHTLAIKGYALNENARKKGLKGDSRLEYVRAGLGRADAGDYRQIRRLISLGKSLHARVADWPHSRS
jgi:hypothetical protein